MSEFHFPYRPRPDDPGAALVVQRNLDFLAGKLQDLIQTFDSGTNIVFVGATTQSVLFSIEVTNPIVSASPTVDPGGRWWISGVNPAGFTFNLEVAAPSSGVAFNWIVRGSGT